MKKHLLTIQNIDEELWKKTHMFLAAHKRIPSLSALAKASLENYLDLASRYGIDVDWKLQIPSNGGGGTDETTKTE